MAGWVVLGWWLGAATALGVAAELPEAVPAGTLLYVGWPGADKLAETCKDTALARLLQEPEMARLRERLGPALEGLARTQIKDAADLEAYSVVQELLTKVWHYPTALAVIGVGLAPTGLQLDAALLVQAGEAATRLASGVEECLGLAGLPIKQVTRVQIGGAEFKELKLPFMAEPLRWGVVKDLFVASIGAKALAHLAPGTTTEPGTESPGDQPSPPASRPGAGPGASSLAASERFAAAMKTVGGSAATPVVFVDLKGLVGTLEKFQPLLAGLQLPVLGEEGGISRVLEGLGLASVQSLSFASVPQAGGFTTSVFLHAPGLKAGLGSLLAQKPVTDEDLRMVAQDASWAVVSNVDLAGMYSGALDAAKGIVPQAHEQVTKGIEEFESRLGMKLREDVLGAFGDTWVIFDAPSNGGLWFTGITVLAELKPGNRLSAALRLVVRAIAALVEDEAGVTLRSEKYRGTEITFVNVAGLPMPVAPAWAEHDGRWILALYPQMVRTTLDRMMDKGASLLDNEDFQRGRKLLPTGGHSISYVDTKAGVGQAYSFVLPIAQMLLAMGQKQGLDLDASMLPRAGTLTRNLFGDVSTAVTTAQGYLSVSHGALPVGMPSLGEGQMAMPLMISILLPSLAHARELSRQSVSAANLQGIATACLVYANDHDGQLPPDLETLTRGGAAGTLSEKTLIAPNDCSGAKTSYIYVAGQKNVMDPRNVLAYERTDLNNGRGVNVAFLDGHVKFMCMDEFNQALAETNGRLGRKEPPREQK